MPVLLFLPGQRHSCLCASTAILFPDRSPIPARMNDCRLVGATAFQGVEKELREETSASPLSQGGYRHSIRQTIAVAYASGTRGISSCRGRGKCDKTPPQWPPSDLFSQAPRETGRLDARDWSGRTGSARAASRRPAYAGGTVGASGTGLRGTDRGRSRCAAAGAVRAAVCGGRRLLRVADESGSRDGAGNGGRGRGSKACCPTRIAGSNARAPERLIGRRENGFAERRSAPGRLVGRGRRFAAKATTRRPF